MATPTASPNYLLQRLSLPAWMRFRTSAQRREQLRTELRNELRSEIEAGMEERINRAAEAGAEKARQEALSDVDAVARSLMATSPLPPVPDPNKRSPYAAYAFDQPIRYSTPQAPSRRPGALVSVETLRQLADTYEILRSCINHLKREVYAVPIEVVPRDEAAKKAHRRDGTLGKPSKDARLAAARALFGKNGAIGGPGTSRRHFEGRLIEDLCVVGAGAIFHERSRGGGLLRSIEIDAATIRPFVDAYGWAPLDTGPGADSVYEQWIYGVQVAKFGRPDLTYDGLYPTTTSPYFKSPVEWILDTIDTALRTKAWNKSWLTDGTTPDQLLGVPDDWSPEQITMFSEWYNSLLAGNNAQRRLTRFVPAGTSRLSTGTRKDNDFAGMDLWLLRVTCSIMGVQPASIGFVGEQYKVSQDASMDQTTAFGAGPILGWRKEIYDDLLERHGFPEFEVVDASNRQKDAKETAETNKILIESGQRTINECRRGDGEDPVENGDVILVPKTSITLESLVAAPPEDVSSTAPAGKDDGSGQSDQSGSDADSADPAASDAPDDQQENP